MGFGTNGNSALVNIQVWGAKDEVVMDRDRKSPQVSTNPLREDVSSALSVGCLA